MAQKEPLLRISKLLSAKKADEIAEVIILDYRGGYRIAKGEALLREIADGGRAREVGIARIAVRNRDEALAIETYLAAIAA